MSKLSQFLSALVIGHPAHGAVLMQRANIDNAGTAVASPSGSDIVMTAKFQESGKTANASGEFKAERVWNAVWNDYADCRKLIDRLEPGRCYIDTIEGARLCTERCQMGVIGVASDTFAQAVGVGAHVREVPIAVAGWVLAHVDRQYAPGTPLTNDAQGALTEMTQDEVIRFPHRMIAMYSKPEFDKAFGPPNKQVLVAGRHWVKVR